MDQAALFREVFQTVRFPYFSADLDRLRTAIDQTSGATPLSYFRVLSGKLTPEQPIISLRTGRGGRSSGLLLIQGKSNKPMTEAIPGDILAVAKVVSPMYIKPR